MTITREELTKRIFENSETVKRAMYTHLQSYFQQLPITRAQLEILSAIKYHQPASSKQIAHQLYLSPGAVSQIVEALDQHGLVVREADRTDRRIQFLKLSKRGEKLLQDIEKRRRSLIEATMKDLSTEELSLWLKVQAQLINQLPSEVKTTKKVIK